MKNLKSIIKVQLAFILLAFSITSVSCTKDLYYTHGTVQEEMDKAVDRGFDGMIVYINQGGESSFYSAGYDDREKQTPANPHALFKIASISKLYMAAAAAMLVVDNELSLENTLADLLPETEGKIEYASEISLRMMIQHRSGIRDYSWDTEVGGESFDDYMSFMARIYNKPALFKPDSRYNYSNSNYLLLGEIMDRALGYSHQDYIQSEILEPLGLVNTYRDYKHSDTSGVMLGYLVDWEPDLRSWDFPLPGGNMVATAEDVGTFLRALIDGTLFTAEEQEIYSSIYEYEHTGWLPGYTSIARYHSDIDAVVVQFVNTSGKEVLWLKLRRVYNRIVRCVEKEKL
ncbi:MAG: beta-lactamase family protein [Bacteroidia bacterium]